MLNNLDEREKIFVFGGIGLVLILVFVNIFMWVVDLRKNLTNQLVDSRGNFTAMDRAIKDYNYYKSLKTGEEESVTEIIKKLYDIMPKYNLDNKLYDTPKESKNIVEKNYTRTSLELHFRSVVLQDVMKMIYDIEVNKQLNGKITYFNFRKVSGKELYDVNLRISSYSRVKK